MIVSELIAQLGFEFDDKDLKKFDTGMKDAKKMLVGVGVAAVASAGAIFAFTKSVAGTNDEIGKQAQILGLAAAELQSWQYAAELGGSSAETMTSSLTNLSKMASEASRGIGGGVEIFGMLGISATTANGQIKDSSILMEEVADRVSKLGSQAQKIEYLEKLGISSDLLLTLDQGSAALKKQRLEAEQLGFTLSKTATKDAAEFNDEFLRISKIVEGISSAIATDLMPEITQMMKIFKEWFIANKKLIKQNLKATLDNMIKGIKVVWNVAKRLWKTVDILVTAFGGWEKAVIALGTALLILNAKALMIPLVLIGIGMAIALLLEDLVTYFNGGESAIGDLVAKFPLLGDALDVLLIVLKSVKFAFDVIWEAVERLFNGTLIDSFSESFKILGGIITDLVATPINAVKDALDYISNIDISNPFANITNPLEDISNPFASGGTLDFLNPMATTAMQPQAITSNNQTVSSPQTNSFEINVTGISGDPKSVASSVKQEVEKVLNNTYKQANKNLKSGVVR